MPDFHTTKEASEQIGASRQIIRSYTKQYARYLSSEATPESGQPRRFTPADVRLLAFVKARTGAGLTHKQVQEELAAGELESFDWQQQRDAPESERSQDTEDSPGTVLVPYAQLQAAQLLLQDAQRREHDAVETAQELQERLEQLQRDLGLAQGELQALKSLQPRRPAWWVRLFGGRPE